MAERPNTALGDDTVLRGGTFEAATYGYHLPFSELFYLAQRGMAPLTDLTGQIKHLYDIDREVPPELVDEFAGRMTRYALGIEALLKKLGINREEAIINIAIGRREKYEAVWESYSAELQIKEDREPTVEEVKALCRERWGKFQFRLPEIQYHILDNARGRYAVALADGKTHDEALLSAWEGIPEEAYIHAYTTEAGVERVLDIRGHTAFDPDLPAIVESSSRFDQRLGQDMAGSVGQVRAEIAEVDELLGFVRADSDDRLEVKFNTIEEFRDHLGSEFEGGRISAQEYERYYNFETLEELILYVEQHLPYEFLDIVFALAGVGAGLNINVEAALRDALSDRDWRYAEPAQTIQEVAADLGIHDMELGPTTIRDLVAAAQQNMADLGGIPEGGGREVDERYMKSLAVAILDLARADRAPT